MFSRIAQRPAAAPSRGLGEAMRRVLIVEPDAAVARALEERLRQIAHGDIWIAADAHEGQALAAQVDPQLVVAALDPAGLAFVRTLRRGELACRQAAVILMAAAPPPAAVLAARDVGAHEVLCRPFVDRDVTRRLEAALLEPRSWIEAVDYVGPDRRRFNSGDYAGARRRVADDAQPPHGVRLGEALKILRSAAEALERDPVQARRALLAQTQALAGLAADLADERLAAGVAAVQGCLTRAGGWDPGDLRETAAVLLAQADSARAA
jgi:DNA-binding response OmpR family regulator